MLFVLTGEGYTAVGRASLGLGRLGWRSWGLALLLPLPVLLVSYGLVWSTGLGELILPSGNLPDLLLNVPINLIIGVLFVLSEEIGFRGYALPRLMGLGVGRALLLSGLMHAAWHLPLVLLTPFYHGEGSRLIVILLFLLTLTAAGMIYGHLRLSSGSLWPPILLHSAFNAFWGFFAAITVTTSALATEYLGGESGLFTLLGVILVAGWLVGWRKRPSYQPA
ncbi:MAG TPA: CPBP family intramembrane metalloprotease [Chloroflexota bacterium]|nr:CPBP family intramembrane metalloprotease [Chloroflexota bacterium]